MLKKLIMCKGLPGSGKSYWASKQQAQGKIIGNTVVITCKDDIRKFLKESSGWEWSPENEREVLKLQNSEIKSAFAQGANAVIVADTNFGKHEARLRGIAKHCRADFEIKDFTQVPVATCIEQDLKRPKDQQVGAEVIKEMYNKYLAGDDFQLYEPSPYTLPAIICDLDGTLATKGDRSPYDYSKVDKDTVNEPIAHIVTTFAQKGYTILYVSGREDSCRHLTELWLSNNHLPVDSPHMLLMRATKDQRKDYIVKKELFDNYIRRQYNVRFVLDDRDQVVAMWRKLGLCCLQVNYGNF